MILLEDVDAAGAELAGGCTGLGGRLAVRFIGEVEEVVVV